MSRLQRFTVKSMSPALARNTRRGAAAILILSMMFVFVAVAAVTVDYAYMQAVRTDLRIATDAAAKAGAEALARTENSTSAVNAAIANAASNKIVGKPFTLTADEVKLGRVTQQNTGKWTFQAGSQPYNSVQVNSKIKTSLFFGKAMEREFFEPKHEAVAGYQEYDVILCLDRSGSMLFDMSGVDYSYPPNNPLLSNFTAWGTTWRYHLSPPHPTNSRWAVLARAVDDFLNIAKDLSPQPYVGLTTWASDYEMPINPYTDFDAATKDVSLPQTSAFQAQMVNVQNKIKNLGKKPMMGGTNLSAGLDLAVNQLNSGGGCRNLSNKVVILLTDGQWNEGRDPVLAAQDASKKGIVVHTISMLTNTQTVLATVANKTGGKSYTTTNETELRNAFKEIAAGLQVVMVE